MQRTAVVVGGGTMGADIALTLARAGCPTHLVEPDAARRARLPAYFEKGLAELGCPEQAHRIRLQEKLRDCPWPAVGIVIEAIPEVLRPKQDLFGQLADLAPPEAWLTSNSSAFPISQIAQGLHGRHRMFGLHYFMPATWVPLVEVVCGAHSDPGIAQDLADFMRFTGKRPVVVKKDLPGFLANRLQHALAREAFALVEAGVASPEDVDAAVRFSFGFRFIAVGPILQRDHAGLDVHCAAAATMYPDLADDKVPSKVLRDHVAAGHLGIKAGKGFYDWPPEKVAAEKARYDRLLRAALDLIKDELQ